MFRHIRVRTFMIASVISLAILFTAFVAGCSAMQKAAKTAETITSPTSQPTGDPATDAIRAIVQIFAGTNPIALATVTAVSIIAGAIGGRRSTKKPLRVARNALVEVAQDVKQYADPHTPWTSTTAKLLTDLGQLTAAVTEPKPVTQAK